jgi:hypothetical protein
MYRYGTGVASLLVYGTYYAITALLICFDYNFFRSWIFVRMNATGGALASVPNPITICWPPPEPSPA